MNSTEDDKIINSNKSASSESDSDSQSLKESASSQKDTPKIKKKEVAKLEKQIADPNEIKKKRHHFYIRLGVFVAIVLAIVAVCLALVFTGHSLIITNVFGDVFINNFLAVPALLIATITVIGNFLQKIIWYKSVISAFKAFAGFVILQLGAAILTGVAGPIMKTFGSVLGINSFYLNPYIGWTNTQKVLNVVADATYIISYIVIIGLAINILLVALRRWTNCLSVNVTGHVMFQQASVLAILFYFIVFKDLSPALRINLSYVFGGIVIGCYWAVFSNLAIKPVQKLTDNAGFTIGHQQVAGIWCAYNAGRLFRRKNKKVVSIDKFKLAKGWSVFQDNLITSCILIFFFFGILLLGIYLANPIAFKDIFVGPNGIGPFNIFAGKSYVLMALLIPFVLAVSIQIIISGARMFIGELQQSFIGISKKLIPGAIIAIDIAGAFAFAQNSIIIGFVAGALGNFVGMGILIALVATKAIGGLNSIILVGFVPMFFDNAAIGIFADKSGGWKACITCAFVSGILIVMGALLITQLGGTYTSDGVTQSVWSYRGAGGFVGMWDTDIIWSLFAGLATLMKAAAPFAILIVVGLFLLIAQLTDTEFSQPNRPNTKPPLRAYLDEIFTKSATKKI